VFQDKNTICDENDATAEHRTYDQHQVLFSQARG